MSVSSAKKKKVAERAKFLCEYCFSPRRFSPDSFSIEHIQPKSKNGSDELENLAFACQGCNGFKGNRTSAIDLAGEKRIPLYNPRKDVWSKHFAWNEDFSELIGLTAKGRITREMLKLNREEVVNLRKILYLFGEHPPK